jgi:hypothetical protein
MLVQGFSIQKYFLGVFNSEPHLGRETQSAYNTIYKVSKRKCVLTIQTLYPYPSRRFT